MTVGQSETSKHGPNWERAGVAFGTGTTRDSEPTHPCAGCGYPLHGDPAEMVYCALCLNRRVHIRQGWTPDAGSGPKRASSADAHHVG
jgi:hypothetical protein